MSHMLKANTHFLKCLTCALALFQDEAAQSNVDVCQTQRQKATVSCRTLVLCKFLLESLRHNLPI